MSTRREDDSRPSGKAVSERNTARDVPAAKFKEGSVGTVAPRGLRGPALLPGQGAPERIVPEEVELAVLRDAETLDGQNVARAVAKRMPLPDPRAPSPTPVSVEVPRVRSIPPSLEDRPSTPPSPSARSIQSGTLMSMGSVDPRAPTELSLPTPRPLSVSERAAYWGPEAVVDRTPVHSPRELPGVVDSSQFGDANERKRAPNSDSFPHSSPRSVPVGSGDIRSARASQMPDSIAPPAQNFARPMPPSASSAYSPTSPVKQTHAEARRSARSGPPSDAEGAPQFQIHSELGALPHELGDDSFDLRSASTLREPLASRKKQESADWTAHAPASEGASRASDPGVRSSPSSYSALQLAADRTLDTAPPTTDRVAPTRASVPVSWVLFAAAFAIVLALLVAWVLRPAGTQEATRTVDGRASAVAPNAPVLPAAPNGVLPTATPELAPRVAAPLAPGSAGPRAPGALQKGILPGGARQMPSAATQPVAPAAAPSSSPPNSDAAKGHQSIY